MVKRPFRRRRKALRLLDLALAAAILAALALVAAREPFFDDGDETLHGVARIGDGDSLTLSGTRIRLEGIDAPELDQQCTRDDVAYPCGHEAKAALQHLIGDAEATCRGGRHDRYGRLLARCTARDIDINRAMVEAGWAVAYGAYGEAQGRARRAGRGLWAGEFEQPQDWRRARSDLRESAHGGFARLFDRFRMMISDLMRGEGDQTTLSR